MALHPDITRKDDISIALGMAADALLIASTQQTGNAGSVTIPNADGSKTLIGVDAGASGVAPWVGDTTAPGKPTGLSVSSKNAAVFVGWDGSMEGGRPFDWGHLQLLATDDEGNDYDFGVLYGAGSQQLADLTPGAKLTVWAIGYDDAHDAQGNSTPNASTPSDPVTVVVQSAVDPDAVEKAQSDAQNALNQAGKAAQNITTEYAVSDSDATSPDDGWSTDEPKPLANQYVWMRTTSTYGDGRVVMSSPTRTTGNSAILVDIHATRGIAFHNNDIDTTLRLTVLCGARRVTTLDELHDVLGSSAYIQWTALTGSERTPAIISNSDPMVTDDGFSLTLSPDNVDVSVTFTADVMS
jgi:hypothetical protein